MNKLILTITLIAFCVALTECDPQEQRLRPSKDHPQPARHRPNKLSSDLPDRKPSGPSEGRPQRPNGENLPSQPPTRRSLPPRTPVEEIESNEAPTN
jgi:hypothetical protein